MSNNNDSTKPPGAEDAPEPFSRNNRSRRFKRDALYAWLVIAIVAGIGIGLFRWCQHIDPVESKQQEDDRRIDLPLDNRNWDLTNKTGDALKINIRKSGAFVIEGKQITEEQLRQTVRARVTKNNQVRVIIRADHESKHLYLANVLSICKSLGVKEDNIMVRTLD